MSTGLEESRLEEGAGINKYLKNLHSGKPYISFNTNTRIIDCSESFFNLVKISSKNFLAIQLTEHALNNNFIEAVRRAETEGISSFRGNVLFGNSIPPVFLEAVMLKIELTELCANEVICLVLQSSENETFHPLVNPTDSFADSLTDKSNTSISIHDSDGNALYISPSTELFFGYSCAELKEINSLNIVYPKDLNIVQDALQQLGKGNDQINTQYRMVHKNGSVIPVESTSYLISDIQGTGKHIVNITMLLYSHAQIERALHRSEQKYFRLLMTLPTGITLINAKGEILEVNDAMKKIMGLSSNMPLQEMNFFDIEVMRRMKIAEQLAKCIETKETVKGEIKYKLSNKERGKYLTYSFVPVLKRSQDVDIVIGYVSDMTQQMKSEIESREHAEFLNLVINAIKAPFFVKDENHKWVILNDAAVAMMGQKREALTGKSDYDIYPKDQADIFWKYDEQVLKNGSISNEEQITWSDGKMHTIVTYKQLYIEKSSGNKFIIGTIHDITEYKKIEEELRASVQKYHELFDNANDFIVTIDLHGNITNANRTLLNHLQTDLKELSSHRVYDFITDENLALAYTFKDRILDGSLKDAFEIEAIGPDREPVTYEVKASLIRQNNIPVGVQCLLSDVTKRRDATLKLEKYTSDLLELNKTKDKFFSIIAHDLRNPYSSMIGFSEMLLEDLEQLTKDEIRESLKMIHNSAKNSFNLLDNLLSWSRLETGRMPFNPTRIVLTEGVEEVISLLFSNAYSKKIEINNLVMPDILLYADKNMLNTILNNLIMNAIKFTSRGGEINIFAVPADSDPESEKPSITISIADTGVGMDSNTLGMLFTSVKLQSQPGTEKEQGTGMGLMLSREMVEKHGGKIFAESQPGKGSVLSFRLPAYIPEPTDIQK